MKRLAMLSFLGVAVVLAGCDQTKTVLGFNRTVNDEFAVLTTPPLSLPPNFNDLPDPVLKSSSADIDNKSTDKARDAALSQFSHSVAHETSKASASETELLRNAKSGDKAPNIRQTIAKESSAEADTKKSFVKDLLNIKSAETALDPYEEKKRLEEAKSNGS